MMLLNVTVSDEQAVLHTHYQTTTSRDSALSSPAMAFSTRQLQSRLQQRRRQSLPATLRLARGYSKLNAKISRLAGCLALLPSGSNSGNA